MTDAEVEEWIQSCFRPLKNISSKVPPEVGESVLWRGVKKGPAGQESTVCEFFNGTVRHVQVCSSNELWIYVD